VNMALFVKQGDLLRSAEVDVIIHQCNCQATMGKGIAKDIKAMFPGAYAADQLNHPYDAPVKKLGHLSSATCKHPSFGNVVEVVNLYGQLHYWKTGSPRDTVWTDYDAVRAGFEKLFTETIPAFQEKTGLAEPLIGIPFNMGCALAGGDWAVYSKIVDEVSTKHGMDVYAYRL
jgi:hypothetical protein